MTWSDFGPHRATTVAGFSPVTHGNVLRFPAPAAPLFVPDADGDSRLSLGAALLVSIDAGHDLAERQDGVAWPGEPRAILCAATSRAEAAGMLRALRALLEPEGVSA